jgi:hypothetical protein
MHADHRKTNNIVLYRPRFCSSPSLVVMMEGRGQTTEGGSEGEKASFFPQLTPNSLRDVYYSLLPLPFAARTCTRWVGGWLVGEERGDEWGGKQAE